MTKEQRRRRFWAKVGLDCGFYCMVAFVWGAFAVLMGSMLYFFYKLIFGDPFDIAWWEAFVLGIGGIAIFDILLMAHRWATKK